MNVTEAVAGKLRGAVRQHEMMLERVWKYRLSNLVEEVQENSPARFAQSVLHCYLTEAETRVADIQRMLLLSVPVVIDAKKEDIINAALDVLAHKVQDIYDDMRIRFVDYCNAMQLHVDPAPGVSEIDAKRESVSVWTSFDLRESILRWLKEQEVLEATFKSAKANAEAAEAEKLSANASMLAAEAAKVTAIWTRWAVIATAAAAVGTAVSAYYTMVSAQASKTQTMHIAESKIDHQVVPAPAPAKATSGPLPDQATQQHVAHQLPVSAGKAK